MSNVDPNLVAGGGVLVSLVASIGSFVAGQRHGRAEFITAVNKAAEVVITKSQAMYDRAETALLKCETDRDECKIEIAIVKARQAAIEQMMHGRVATYSDKAPRDA